jgi:hypothetical protein
MDFRFPGKSGHAVAGARMTEFGPTSDIDGIEIPQCSGLPAPVYAIVWAGVQEGFASAHGNGRHGRMFSQAGIGILSG